MTISEPLFEPQGHAVTSSHDGGVKPLQDEHVGETSDSDRDLHPIETAANYRPAGGHTQVTLSASDMDGDNEVQREQLDHPVAAAIERQTARQAQRLDVAADFFSGNQMTEPYLYPFFTWEEIATLSNDGSSAISGDGDGWPMPTTQSANTERSQDEDSN
jgi:hypothetical protein